MVALQLTGNALHKAEMKYDGNFGGTLIRIQNIALMSRIGIFNTSCRLETQTMEHLQGIRFCIKYLISHPHKPIFYPSNSHDGSNIIRLTWSGNQFEEYKTHNW